MRLVWGVFILLLFLVAPVYGQQTAVEWFHQGVAHYNQGNYTEAIRCWDEAIGIDPNYAEAWSNKGIAYYQRGIGTMLFECCYHKASRLDPYDTVVAYDTYGSQRYYDEAIRCYDEAIRINPDLDEAWYNKGVALRMQGNYTEAIRCYDEAIRLDPDYAPAWYSKGLAYDGQGNYTEAIRCYDEAIRLDPDYARVWSSKGVAYRAIGDDANADAAFARARELGLG